MEKQLTFEQAMKRLEELVALLESGNCPLEETMKLFEEGAGLVSFCSQTLKDAQQKIVQLHALQPEE